MADPKDILEQMRLVRLRILQDQVDSGYAKNQEMSQMSEAEFGEPTSEGYKKPFDVINANYPKAGDQYDRADNLAATVSAINEKRALEEMPEEQAKRFQQLLTPIKGK